MKYKWTLVTMDDMEDIITSPEVFDTIDDALSNYITFGSYPVFECSILACEETGWTDQYWFKINDHIELNIWKYASSMQSK